MAAICIFAIIFLLQWLNRDYGYKIMMLKQRIVGLIWAAILVVAVQFVPNLAYAHGGHAHQSFDVAITSDATASGPLSGQQSLHEAEVLAVVVYQDHTSDAPVSGCVGGCCNAGIGCCGAAILSTSPMLPSLDDHAGIVSRELPRQSGIEPDTSAKPPRFFA
jgi:hypothetical protein